MIQQHPPPEHLHYAAIEKFLQDSIATGANFLFDKILLDAELRRLWELYHVPYPVSALLLNEKISSRTVEPFVHRRKDDP
jgi:hypothetical protein